MAQWKTQRLSDDELLAGAEHWRSVQPPRTATEAHGAWMDQYRSWAAENGTTILELIRMARVHKGKNY